MSTLSLSLAHDTPCASKIACKVPSLLVAPDAAACFIAQTSCAPCAGGNPSQSFKEAALNDPFADLGNVRATQPTVPQTTPPLREVSPTQQRINLGALPAQPPLL